MRGAQFASPQDLPRCARLSSAQLCTQKGMRRSTRERASRKIFHYTSFTKIDRVSSSEKIVEQRQVSRTVVEEHFFPAAAEDAGEQYDASNLASSKCRREETSTVSEPIVQPGSVVSASDSSACDGSSDKAPLCSYEGADELLERLSRDSTAEKSHDLPMKDDSLQIIPEPDWESMAFDFELDPMIPPPPPPTEHDHMFKGTTLDEALSIPFGAAVDADLQLTVNKSARIQTRSDGSRFSRLQTTAFAMNCMGAPAKSVHSYKTHKIHKGVSGVLRKQKKSTIYSETELMQMRQAIDEMDISQEDRKKMINCITARRSRSRLSNLVQELKAENLALKAKILEMGGEL